MDTSANASVWQGLSVWQCKEFLDTSLCSVWQKECSVKQYKSVCQKQVGMTSISHSITSGQRVATIYCKNQWSQPLRFLKNTR